MSETLTIYPANDNELMSSDNNPRQKFTNVPSTQNPTDNVLKFCRAAVQRKSTESTVAEVTSELQEQRTFS